MGAEGRHAPVPRDGRKSEKTLVRSKRHPLLAADGSATTWATARSPCTHPPSTTAGQDPIQRYTTAQSDSLQLRGPSSGNIHASRSAGPNDAPQRPSNGDIFDAYVATSATPALVEKVYQLEKAGGFSGEGTPDRAPSPPSASPRDQHVARHDLHGLGGQRCAVNDPTLVIEDWSGFLGTGGASEVFCRVSVFLDFLCSWVAKIRLLVFSRPLQRGRRECAAA